MLGVLLIVALTKWYKGQSKQIGPAFVSQIDVSGQRSVVSMWKLTKTVMGRKKGVGIDGRHSAISLSYMFGWQKMQGPDPPHLGHFPSVHTLSHLEGRGNVFLQDREQACLLSAVKRWAPQAQCFSPGMQPTACAGVYLGPPSAWTLWGKRDKKNWHKHANAYVLCHEY